MKKHSLKNYVFCFLFYSNAIIISQNPNLFRNPFAFSDLDYNRIKFNKVSKLDLDSKSFAVIKHKKKFDIAESGQDLFGYKIIDILNDYIIIKDNSDNEAIILLD